MDRKFSWSKAHKVPAQVVGEFYYSLPERTPEALLAASRSKKAPTHALFNWNDTAAAREYRLLQARLIVSSLEIEISDAKGRPRHVKAFIRDANDKVHVPIMEASQSDITAEEARLLDEMRRFKERIRGLQFFREVFLAMQAVEAKASRARRKAA